MNAVANQIISIIDRLSHSSTTDQDALQTVCALRRKLKGEMASTFFQHTFGASSSEVSTLRKVINGLKGEIQDLEQENEELRNDQAYLTDRISKFTVTQIPDQPLPRPDGDYSFQEVNDIIISRCGKFHGSGVMWADYSENINAGDSAVLVTTARIQSWRKKKVFPRWAVEQLLAMPVTEDKPKDNWSNQERDFLCKLHLADLHMSDDALAKACTREFGRKIGTNSIKGQFTKLRAQQRIPQRRPKR
jgi:hypothetical protein